ncbi:MAG TPA: HD domain-containing protein [Patescibacteria group bacterium]|nr:HD domain-containing protein [Patescibacteria group bacterium]
MGKPTKPDIRRLIEFHKLLLDFRAVERKMRIPGTKQLENDVDHSYTLAMMAWFLAPHFPELDRDMVIRMSLVHDIIEVHAGDTPVFGDSEHLGTKAQREADALAQLTIDWPDFPEMTRILHEYEARDNDEAMFVYALDKAMPLIMGTFNGGLDYRGQNVTQEAAHASKRHKVALSPPINDYYYELLDLLAKEHPKFFAVRSDPSQQR